LLNPQLAGNMMPVKQVYFACEDNPIEKRSLTISPAKPRQKVEAILKT
jgi:hypothetical protein